MLKRKTAESRQTFGAGRRLLFALPDFLPRLFRIVLVAAAAGAAAYFLQARLLSWLFAHVGTQPFAYTSAGQLGTLPTLYVSVGLIVAIPVAAYYILRAMESRFVRVRTSYFLGLAFVSASLAAAGVYFGYYYGLPHALQFLPQQFLPDPAEPLAAVHGYVQFASVYLLMSAVVYQAPLVFYVLNVLKVQRVRSLLQRQRPVLLASLVLGAAVNPSDDVIAMVVIALPAIFMYQVGVLTVWTVNRFNRAEAAIAKELMSTDAATQAERFDQLEAALRAPLLEPVPVASPDIEQEMPVLPPSPEDTYKAPMQSQPPVASSTAHPASHHVPKEPAAPAAPVREEPMPHAASGRHEKPTSVAGIRRRIY